MKQRIELRILAAEAFLQRGKDFLRRIEAGGGILPNLRRRHPCFFIGKECAGEMTHLLIEARSSRADMLVFAAREARVEEFVLRREVDGE